MDWLCRPEGVGARTRAFFALCLLFCNRSLQVVVLRLLCNGPSGGRAERKKGPRRSSSADWGAFLTGKQTLEERCVSEIQAK